MPRPNKPKRVKKLPLCDRFYPEKGKGSVHEILMTVEEYETLRLIVLLGWVWGGLLFRLCIQKPERKSPDFLLKGQLFISAEAITVWSSRIKRKPAGEKEVFIR